MQTLYVFSKPGEYLSSVAKSTNGLYLVKGCSVPLLAAAETLQASGWREVSRALSFDFVKELRTFISSLNEVNISPFWWKLNFTDKSPLASNFHDWVYCFLKIVEIFNDPKNHMVVFITDDAYSVKQSKTWAKKNGIKVIDMSRFDLKWIIKQYTPIGPLFAFVRTLMRHYYDLIVLFGKRHALLYRENRIVFAPLINHTSFKDGAYVDLYFDPLLRHVEEAERTYCVLGLILKPYYTCVKKLRVLSPHNFITVNYLVALSDLIKCIFENLKYLYLPIAWAGDNTFSDIDIKHIVRDAIKEDLCSTKYFTNSVFYYSALRLFRKIRPEYFIYPFEAHPWERMMLMALKEVCPCARSVGFQHVSINPRHANFMFSRQEASVVPFPDRIVTLGHITRNIMVKNNPFLENRVESGCALRQGQRIAEASYKQASGVFTVAVIMASTLREHVALIKLSNACALAGKGNWRFIVRGHPSINYEHALQISGQMVDCCERSEGHLSGLLNSVDAVMYTSSTVAIEALAAGKPVMYADVGDYISPDPLFDYTGTVFRIKNNTDFIEAVSALRNMSRVEFSAMVAQGVDYASKYFLKVTHDRMETFFI